MGPNQLFLPCGGGDGLLLVTAISSSKDVASLRTDSIVDSSSFLSDFLLTDGFGKKTSGSRVKHKRFLLFPQRAPLTDGFGASFKEDSKRSLVSSNLQPCQSVVNCRPVKPLISVGRTGLRARNPGLLTFAIIDTTHTLGDLLRLVVAGVGAHEKKMFC